MWFCPVIDQPLLASSMWMVTSPWMPGTLAGVVVGTGFVGSCVAPGVCVKADGGGCAVVLAPDRASFMLTTRLPTRTVSSSTAASATTRDGPCAWSHNDRGVSM